MLPVAIFRFSPTETPGRFGDWLDARRASRGELIALDEGAPVPVEPGRAFAGIGMMGGPMSVNDKLPWIAPLCSAAARRDLRRHAGDRPLPRRPADGARRWARRVTRMPRAGDRLARTSTSCDRGARREWFGGLPRFAAFQWHYDAFDLPPMATRVLTNDVAVNQGFVIDDRHVGFQCHIEMTRELVETWCRARRRRAARALERASAERGRPAERPRRAPRGAGRSRRRRLRALGARACGR